MNDAFVISPLPAVQQLLDGFRNRSPRRATSLIVTIFGDAILPRGGSVWLGSLIRLLEVVDLNERLVRTSVLRLGKEHWLQARQLGRRSYYSVTDTGRRRFQRASRRIYAGVQSDWDGTLSVLITTQVAPGQREALRRELQWAGFGSVAPGVLVHPRADREALNALLTDLEAQDAVVLLDARVETLPLPRPLEQLVHDCWSLEALADSYQCFLELYRPVWRALDSVDELDPAQAFWVRTLLIHDFRRVLLRDPLLPTELLPSDWPGTAARLLCRNIYQRVLAPAERYLTQMLETADGPLPAPGAGLRERFGGV